MFKKIIVTAIFGLLLVFLSNSVFINAEEKVRQDKVTVDLILNIKDFVNEDFEIIEEDGKYYLIISGKDGSKNKHEITKDEAMELGYVIISKEDIITVDNSQEKNSVREDNKQDDNLRNKQESIESAKENKLPSTATNIYNLLFIGGIILSLGFIVLFLKRKRSKTKS